MSVSIHPPRTPVTTGSSGTATATLPNVCKMPGPPAPFVPTPLPNIGKSGSSPKGYSQSVTIEGEKVAIKGATFGSSGDVASQGTGGGLLSANTEGPTSFIGPGAMDVKIEGKSVQFLGDPMLNNCGKGGSPANAATMVGVIQANELVSTGPWTCPTCHQSPDSEDFHDGLSESEGTKADAATLASNFATQVQDVTCSTSTMLGVVYCKCGAKYADQSGVTTTELCRAAQAAGMKHPSSAIEYRRPPESNTDYGKRKAAAEQATQTKIKDWLTKKLGQLEADNKWIEAETLAEESLNAARAKKKKPAAYPPGSCAAQKALVLLLDDGSGGRPIAMTERHYSSSGSATGGSIQYTDSRGATVLRAFEHGESVAPCGTCELLLPYLLPCPEEKEAPCAHKS